MASILIKPLPISPLNSVWGLMRVITATQSAAAGILIAVLIVHQDVSA
jgi:hypothetical protein